MEPIEIATSSWAAINFIGSEKYGKLASAVCKY